MESTTDEAHPLPYHINPSMYFHPNFPTQDIPDNMMDFDSFKNFQQMQPMNGNPQFNMGNHLMQENLKDNDIMNQMMEMQQQQPPMMHMPIGQMKGPQMDINGPIFKKMMKQNGGQPAGFEEDMIARVFPPQLLMKTEDMNNMNMAGMGAMNSGMMGNKQRKIGAMGNPAAALHQGELIKKEAIDSHNRSDDDNSDEDGKKKRIYNKKTNEKIKRWTKDEGQRYDKFIEMHMDIFSDTNKKKRGTKIFLKMSKFIGTKTPSQCRSHHQKFYKKKFPHGDAFFPYTKCEEIGIQQHSNIPNGPQATSISFNNDNAGTINQSANQESTNFSVKEKAEENKADDIKKPKKKNKLVKDKSKSSLTAKIKRPNDPQMPFVPNMMMKGDGYPYPDDSFFDPSIAMPYATPFFPPNFNFPTAPYFMNQSGRPGFGQNPLGDPSMDVPLQQNFLENNNNNMGEGFPLIQNFNFDMRKDQNPLMGGPNPFMIPPGSMLGPDERKKNSEEEITWNEHLYIIRSLDQFDANIKNFSKAVEESFQS